MRTFSSSLIRTAARGALVVLLWSGCSGDEPEAPPNDPWASLPGTLWDTDLSRIPSTATVANTRAAIPVGEEVVVSGRVKEFAPGLAKLAISDDTLESCTEQGRDCATPWDFCGQPAERLRSHTITVEFRDENGRPFPQSLDGFRGLDHLTPVRVRGVVERDASGAVVLASDRIYFRSP